MKNILIAILALLYIATSTGAMVHVHYCMGEVDDWGLGYIQTKVCGKCGMDETEMNDTRCCKDEHTFIKSVNDQKIAETNFHFAGFAGTAFVSHVIEPVISDVFSVTEKNPLANAPPRWSGVAVYLFKRTFLI